MLLDFAKEAIPSVFKGFGNILFNGFDFDIPERDKVNQIGINLHHFNPWNEWSADINGLQDVKSGEHYCSDSYGVVRAKCAAVFAATFVVQPIGLTLNLINRIGKVVTFAHFWNHSNEKYSFKARLSEWGMDILRVVTTPLIFIGMLFSSLYGATISPFDGRKLYGSFERFAYSGGYQHFNEFDHFQNHLIAPCFQPDPKSHLGGGDIDEVDVW